MSFPTRAGRGIGLLLLVQLVTGLILPYVLLLPLTAGPAGFLDSAAARSDLVRFMVLLLFIGGAASVAISVAAWPALRARSYRLGLWLLVLAVVNFMLQLVENAHWLTMVSVSEAYAQADADAAGQFQILGIGIRSAWKWAHYSHILVVVGWLFTLYWLLLRCALVPRALAAVGMAATVLHFIGITLPAFAGYRMPMPELFGLPLGLANLVLAAWLMAKGFKPAPAAK